MSGTKMFSTLKDFFSRPSKPLPKPREMGHALGGQNLGDRDRCIELMAIELSVGDGKVWCWAPPRVREEYLATARIAFKGPERVGWTFNPPRKVGEP